MPANTTRFGSLAGLIFSTCLALLLIPAQAQAAPPEAVGPLSITVGGTNYDIQFLQNTSFAANQAFLTTPANAPWWSSQALATDFREAYLTKYASLFPAEGPFGLLFDTDAGHSSLLFAYKITPADKISSMAIGATATGYTRLGFDVDPTMSGSSGAYAYVAASPAAVPEINAGSLSQALLILFALWLVTRRRAASGLA